MTYRKTTFADVQVGQVFYFANSVSGIISGTVPYTKIQPFEFQTNKWKNASTPYKNRKNFWAIKDSDEVYILE
jgi:hypothetical protein